MTTTSTFDRDFDSDGNELQERVVQIRRVAKVVKGGRNLHFNAMVVVGDGRGRVGMGLGKGLAVPDAVRNGNAIARRNMIAIPLNGSTIHHTVNTKFGASRVLMKPAKPGAGVIAGGAVRAVMEALGVRDVVAKALGSRNPINVVKATMAGLVQLQGEHTPMPEEVVQAERAAQRRREAARPDTSSRSRPGDRRRADTPPSGAKTPIPTEQHLSVPDEDLTGPGEAATSEDTEVVVEEVTSEETLPAATNDGSVDGEGSTAENGEQDEDDA